MFESRKKKSFKNKEQVFQHRRYNHPKKSKEYIDLVTVADRLKKFFLEKSRENLLPKIDKFISTRLDNIIYHVYNDDVLQNTIQNFIVIDCIMSTDTYNKKV